MFVIAGRRLLAGLLALGVVGVAVVAGLLAGRAAGASEGAGPHAAGAGYVAAVERDAPSWSYVLSGGLDSVWTRAGGDKSVEPVGVAAAAGPFAGLSGAAFDGRGLSELEAALDGGEGFSLELWVKVPAGGGGGELLRLPADGGAGGVVLSVDPVRESDRAQVVFAAGGRSASASMPATGGWHQLVVTASAGGTLSVFVDGQRRETEPVDGADAASGVGVLRSARLGAGTRAAASAGDGWHGTVSGVSASRRLGVCGRAEC